MRVRRSLGGRSSLRVIDVVEGATLTVGESKSSFMTGEFGAFVRSVEAADEKETLISGR